MAVVRGAGSLPLAQAQTWADQQLRSHTLTALPWEHDTAGPETWSALDPLRATLYFLRHHPDGWKLLKILARRDGDTLTETTAWSDAPAGLRFIGPVSATGSTAPLPPWWDDLDGSRPVVHVSQGKLANHDLGQLIGPALKALAGEDVLVVVATGGRPLDALPPLPANARAATFLPYDDLLPRTSVFVTNGGYGGVHYALRYGVPIVATGGPEVGARIAWSGVGIRFKQETPSPPRCARQCSGPCATTATEPPPAGSPTGWTPRPACAASRRSSTRSPPRDRAAPPSRPDGATLPDRVPVSQSRSCCPLRVSTGRLP